MRSANLDGANGQLEIDGDSCLNTVRGWSEASRDHIEAPGEKAAFIPTPSHNNNEEHTNDTTHDCC